MEEAEEPKRDNSEDQVTGQSKEMENTDTTQDTEKKEDESTKNPSDTQTGSLEQTTTEEEVQEENIKVDPEVIEKLTTGVLGLFLPNLQKARGTLNECLHNQEVLIETIQQENAKFSESAAMQQLIRTMQEARIYQNKLVNMKKEMNNLTERSAKIKKRAVRLQQQKQKEDLERAAQKDRETEKERMLAAKVAKDAK